MLAVAEWSRRQMAKACCFGFDPPAALTGVVIAPPQLFWLEIARGAELPVGISVPVHTAPRLALRQPSEAHLHPVLLDQRQVVQQTGECQFGGCVLLGHLRLGQPVGLRQHGLALVVEVLPEQGGFRASGVRIDSHTLMLAVSAGPCIAAGSSY